MEDLVAIHKVFRLFLNPLIVILNVPKLRDKAYENKNNPAKTQSFYFHFLSFRRRRNLSKWFDKDLILVADLLVKFFLPYKSYKKILFLFFQAFLQGF
ncbi:hypothetical protein D0809_17995 [Flavobacterium circumlabens]|uniref:Uncharacterized protein n=1 Tax=Flavobacterium circumlabens TaxID=2133765 RepID=A0A4Y7U953_9FLAO|nr:hypothetical protein D0809_17995 [Flavobacterium circumlabens]